MEHFFSNIDLHNHRQTRGVSKSYIACASINLSTDSSVSQNIAFGIPPSEIDLTRVKDSASKAFIIDFIECNWVFLL